MKPLLTLLFATLCCVASWSQEAPNRLIVAHSNKLTGYALEGVDSMYFTNVKGPVAAKVTFQRFATGDADTIWCSVQRTENCKTFRILTITSNIAKQINDAASCELLFDRMGATTKYNENFESAQMTGFSKKLTQNADYTIITLGYDEFDVACEISKAEFKTPKPALVGDPKFTTIEAQNVSSFSFDVLITGNDDVKGFAAVAMPEGQLQQQFDQFGPMMGLASISDMIKSWGFKASGKTETFSWTEMIPNTKYEVWVQGWDKNDSYMDPVKIDVQTPVAGGHGTPEMTINVGKFEYNEENQCYVQTVTFTPNADAGLHHDIIMSDSAYNANGADKVKEMLMSESPMTAQWDQFGVDNFTFQCDPKTTWYAVSMAQNADGKWSEVALVRFTTPEKAEEAPITRTPARAIAKRLVAEQNGPGAFIAPFKIQPKKEVVLK